MKVTVQYHAMLREQKGCAEEQAEIEMGTLIELHQKLNLCLEPKHLKVAINDELAAWDQQLKENDVVIFIPPVAGG